jgi:hypothetical protein
VNNNNKVCWDEVDTQVDLQDGSRRSDAQLIMIDDPRRRADLRKHALRTAAFVNADDVDWEVASLLRVCPLVFTLLINSELILETYIAFFISLFSNTKPKLDNEN